MIYGLNAGRPRGLRRDRETGARAQAYPCDVADFGRPGRPAPRSWPISGPESGQQPLHHERRAFTCALSEADFDGVLVSTSKARLFHKTPFKSILRLRGPDHHYTSVSASRARPGGQLFAAKAGLIGPLRKRSAGARSPGAPQRLRPRLHRNRMTGSAPAWCRDETAVPLKRMGRPEDVAELAVFLASDLAAYITGEVIRVDGGMCM